MQKDRKLAVKDREEESNKIQFSFKFELKTFHWISSVNSLIEALDFYILNEI